MDLQTRETLIGAAVVAGLSLFLAFSYSQKGESSTGMETYSVVASFARADGLHVGSSVRVSGVDVGHIVDQKLDRYYQATVTMELPTSVQLPIDSSASIRSDGLLGAKYVEVEPGGELDMLSSGGRIEYTQDTVLVEELLSKIVEMAKAKRAAPATETPVETPVEEAPATETPL